MTPAWRVLGLGLGLALTAGCRLDVQLGVVVTANGSGAVTVAVALDEAAAARVPDLADQLEVDDLVATSWTVTGPALEDDGLTWVRASKPFESVEAAGAVVDEVSGVDGPLRDFEVRRSPSLLRDEWHLTGTVDLTPGLASFSDDQLRVHLDGTDVGMTEEELVAVAGRPIEEVLTFSVVADLPGAVTSDGWPAGAGAAVWQPELGRSSELAATGTRLNTVTVVWLAVGAVSLLCLVSLTAARTVRRR